ncbi:LOW QUALITY PROTEIN: hypothetical protein PHMEG_00032140 [Phytophthora megakarya]|uniref:Uncharacterized protein n=1 Tax=Phytophthora megakarya TaxID=4795 RepID=A0A225UW62_9STRA|nr:LOW QUALITY PROTEIN: hypothetical protein PHMEG_00032140 [Phytophthora megakarya]
MVMLETYKAEMERMSEGLAEKSESVLKRHIHGLVMTLEPMKMAFESVLARSNEATLFGAVLLSTACLPSRCTNSTIFKFSYVKWGLSLSTNRILIAFWDCPHCAGAMVHGIATAETSAKDMTTRGMKVRLAELQRLMHHVESPLADDEVIRAYSSTDSAGVFLRR